MQRVATNRSCGAHLKRHTTPLYLSNAYYRDQSIAAVFEHTKPFTHVTMRGARHSMPLNDGRPPSINPHIMCSFEVRCVLGFHQRYLRDWCLELQRNDAGAFGAVDVRAVWFLIWNCAAAPIVRIYRNVCDENTAAPRTTTQCASTIIHGQTKPRALTVTLSPKCQVIRIVWMRCTKIVHFDRLCWF